MRRSAIPEGGIGRPAGTLVSGQCPVPAEPCPSETGSLSELVRSLTVSLAGFLDAELQPRCHLAVSRDGNQVHTVECA